MFLSRRRPFSGRVFILALATLAATASLTSVGAQAPDPRELCRDGGFARFRDPSTGQPFRNQGQCVRTGAQGGALDPLPDLVVTKHCTRTSPTFVSCTVTVRNTGLGPAALPAGTPLLRDVLSLTTGAINLIEMQSPAGYDSAISDPCLGASQCTITLTAVVDQTFLPGDTLAVMHEVRASEAGATVTNTATVDPANAVGEANDGNNAVTIITPP